MKKLRAACVQIAAGADPEKNLLKARRLFGQAVKAGARIVAFPENFFWRGAGKDMARAAAFTLPALREYRSLAAKYKTAVLLGGMPERAAGKKFYNTAVLIDEKGRVAARYRKIHLFDVRLKDVKVCESRNTQPGKKIAAGKIHSVKAGLSVCYDIRFPELFRRLAFQGSRVLFIPANFTAVTGKAHWELLARARAVENLAFVIAPGMSGSHPTTGLESFGTSLIVDPWGRVLCRGGRAGEGVFYADLDLKAQAGLRARFPVLRHKKLF